jgi:hypothetical protein
MKKVLKDERFSKYKVKFPEPKGLDPSLWSCSDYIEVPDSISDDENENVDYSEDTPAPNNSNLEPETGLSTPEE